jgi:hypothetical protein
MPGQTYAHLKRRFQSNFKINLEPGAEKMMQDISVPTKERNFSGFTRSYPEIKSETFSDKMSSLLLLRGMDIVITRRETLNSPRFNLSSIDQHDLKINTLTTSDVLLSIYTMPCKCPQSLACCENIRSKNLSYLVVFPNDIGLLNSLGVKNMDEFVTYFSKDDFKKDVQDIWTDSKVGVPHEMVEDLRYIPNLIHKKIEVWMYSYNYTVVPLIKMFEGKAGVVGGTAIT